MPRTLIGGWLRPLTPRDPHEGGRVASALELLTDLCFVVAVSQAAATMHHQLSGGHIGRAVAGFVMAFFAIFWAWLNFTWFASAYDSDDTAYRLLTILQIVGSLFLAAGMPTMVEEGRSTAAVLGYVLMRIALVTQWLRAGRGDPQRRRTTHRYALGITLVQLGWVAFLFVPHALLVPWFVLFVVAELAVPAWAERAGETTWHPHHVAERYSLFFIIVLGEMVLSTTVAIQEAVDAGDAAAGLVEVVAGAVVVVFSLWWLYFCRNDAEVLTQQSVRSNLLWGYGHYFLFASAAAVGAVLAVRVDHYSHHTVLSGRGSALAVVIPVAALVVAIFVIHLRLHEAVRANWAWVGAAVALILLGALTPIPTVVAGLAVAGLVVAFTRRPGPVAASLHPVAGSG